MNTIQQKIPQTKQELAIFLGISRHTLRRYLKTLQFPTSNHLLSPQEVRKICEKLGYIDELEKIKA